MINKNKIRKQNKHAKISMSGQEDYEHFSAEFKAYWHAPRNADKIKLLENEYDKLVQQRIAKNIAKLEKCIKTETADIITNKPYDKTFECFLDGLPPYVSTEQGYGELIKTKKTYTDLQYVKKPLEDIGLTLTTNKNIDKNEFKIYSNNSDFIISYGGWVEIRISNSSKEPKYV